MWVIKFLPVKFYVNFRKVRKEIELAKLILEKLTIIEGRDMLCMENILIKPENMKKISSNMYGDIHSELTKYTMENIRL